MTDPAAMPAALREAFSHTRLTPVSVEIGERGVLVYYEGTTMPSFCKALKDVPGWRMTLDGWIDGKQFVCFEEVTNGRER